METKVRHGATIEVAENIESKYWVDYVESGLPRWLIEAAFVCIVIQAVFNWSPVIDLTDEDFFWLRAIINTFGTLVMYIGLLRGCRNLYRPFRAWWWALIVLDILGFLTMLVPAIDDFCGLPVAVSLMLVYLPFGCLIAYCYRGGLRQVGIWMALYILLSSIAPVLWYLSGAPDSGIINWLMEISTVGVILVYGWVMRRVLIADTVGVLCRGGASLRSGRYDDRRSLPWHLRPLWSSWVPRATGGNPPGCASR